tara:strand:- start:436 stop:948 length:513 start_codon:yes stop_codon:yes gene_type:complete
MTFSERDIRILSLLYPPFKEMTKRFMVLCWEAGLPVRLTNGLRTFAEQDELLAKGTQVTKAKGGYSYHNYGIAFDICFGNFDDGKTPNPYVEPVAMAWEKCARIGLRCGLQPGYMWTSFQDKPHYQANIKASISDLRSAFLKGGTIGLYDFLNTHEKDSFFLPPSAATLE